jgi:hypothetical protein
MSEARAGDDGTAAGNGVDLVNVNVPYTRWRVRVPKEHDGPAQVTTAGELR